MLSDERAMEIERRILRGESLRTVAAAERVAVSTVQRIANLGGLGRRRPREPGALRKARQRRAVCRASNVAATIFCEDCKQPVAPVDGRCLLCYVRKLKREDRAQFRAKSARTENRSIRGRPFRG